jgi:hypothetical protein
MRMLRGLAAETEGRRGSQTRLREGGRYLDTPENRPAAAMAINPNPSPFSVSHFRGALHGVDGE